MSAGRGQETVRIVVDGRELEVAAGVTLAAALLDAGVQMFRRSVRGDPRAPLCGMGICQECRMTIDQVAHRRACLVTVASGMTVSTQGAVSS
jgi:predicted molibdopterin-dependent oxidoreductase YjgC